MKKITNKLVIGISIIVAVLLTATQIVNAITVTNITPNQGPTSGNNIVTITGTGFQPDTPTLQGFGADKCASMSVYNGSNIGALLTLTDTRGGQAYTVGKLADGKCWMLDNLKLGSTTGTTLLTPADTNISSSFTLPQIGNQTMTGSYTAPYATTVPGDTGTGATNYGYLYNWCAATAGNPSATQGQPGYTCTPNNIQPDNAIQDICPVGWRMPRGFNADPAQNDFAVLNGYMAGDNMPNQNNSWNTKYDVGWQFRGPFRGVLSGHWWNETFRYQCEEGTLWASNYRPGRQWAPPNRFFR